MQTRRLKLEKENIRCKRGGVYTGGTTSISDER